MDSSCTNNEQIVPWYSTMAAKVSLPCHDDNNHEGDRGMLFVGSLSAAECLQFIRDCEITHILTVAAGLDVNIPKVPHASLRKSESDNEQHYAENSVRSAVEHLVVECHDHPMANILEVFPQCLSFIHGGLQSTSRLESNEKQVRGRVLVHCASGVSRSVTVCAAYLMMMAHSYQQCVKASDAIASIASVRRFANPNLGFRRQLALLERHISKDIAVVGKGVRADHQHRLHTTRIVESTQKEFVKLQSNVVEDTIRQRTVVNELHARVDVQEEQLAIMKSRISNTEDGDDNGKTTSDADSKDNINCGNSEFTMVKERERIRTSLLRLQAELDACLPVDGEGLIDPPARMIRRAANAKITRLLETLSA